MRLLPSLLLAAACGGAPETPATGAAGPDRDTAADGDADPPSGLEDPLYSGTWTVPTWAAYEGLPLPPGPEGAGYHLIEATEGTLWFDPDLRDPVVSAGVCATVVQACFAPGERNLHGCLLNGPTCATDRPWEEEAMCCPAACLDGYRARREAGQGEIDALSSAIFDADGCTPGLGALLEGGAR